MLPMKVQQTLGFTQLSTSKRSPQTPQNYLPFTYVKINLVEPFSVSFPPSVEFCSTSQMLKVLGTGSGAEQIKPVYVCTVSLDI